jgi:hypothetical protein
MPDLLEAKSAPRLGPEVPGRRTKWAAPRCACGGAVFGPEVPGRRTKWAAPRCVCVGGLGPEVPGLRTKWVGPRGGAATAYIHPSSYAKAESPASQGSSPRPEPSCVATSPPVVGTTWLRFGRWRAVFARAFSRFHACSTCLFDVPTAGMCRPALARGPPQSAPRERAQK